LRAYDPTFGHPGARGVAADDVEGLEQAVAPYTQGTRTVKVKAEREGADPVEVEARVRLDTPNEVAYYRNGGILHRVLRGLR